MKKLFAVLFGLIILMIMPGIALATVLTFDDLPNSDTGTSFIPLGYNGFLWSNFNYLTTSNFNFNPSGYQAGTVSPNNVAFNKFGAPAYLFSDTWTPFNFQSVYLTGAWNDDLNINIIGYLKSSEVYNQTIIVSATSPYLFTANWTNIDMLYFNSYGGTQHAEYSASGWSFAMDNFTFNANNAVPIPPSVWMLGSGLIGLVGLRRKFSAFLKK